MTNRVIEVVSFRLAPGVSDEEFLKTVPASSEFVAGMPGFVARRLSRGEDGRWLEHIEWQTLEQAQAAAQMFMKEEGLKPMIQAIDGAGARMSHNRLHVSLG
ncbi:MAG TPA: hypothetical protein ENJ90_11840 [Devosia sp.]|nr:hypothetical protein [Devosia sp.]